MIDGWEGKWALVTGASAGIGKALAVELARGGANLVLTARRRDRLEALAKELSATYGVKTQTVAADLTEAGAPQAIFQFTEQNGLQIDLLVNNAGFGQYGEMYKVEVQRRLEMGQVNCSAGLTWTRRFLPQMVARRARGVLIVRLVA